MQALCARNNGAQENENHACNLHAGLYLARPSGSHCGALHRGNRAQRGDDKFTGENDKYHPACHQTAVNENDHCRTNEQLIRERIDKFAKIRHLMIFACHIAIKKVGKAAHAEQHQRDDITGHSANRRKNDEKRNQRNARQSNLIRKCHNLSHPYFNLRKVSAKIIIRSP